MSRSVGRGLISNGFEGLFGKRDDEKQGPKGQYAFCPDPGIENKRLGRVVLVKQLPSQSR